MLLTKLRHGVQSSHGGHPSPCIISTYSGRGEEMNTENFLNELDSRIKKYDLLCHPFYKAWAAGELTREDLREYGREYYRHVEAFPAYLNEFASRASDPTMRRAVLANRDEQIGADGSTAHAELCLDFVEDLAG